MNVRQLIAELNERDPETEIEVVDGPIVDIEMTSDGRYILTGETDDIE